MTPEQLRECPVDQCAENTDREIYRGPDDGCGDYYSDSLHITQEGALGIDCGGYVIVKPIRTWHGLAKAHAAALEELAKVEAALAECRARLEIDFATDGSGKRVPVPAGAPDGIACRDETIRLLEAALAESERRCERLKFHAEAMAKYLTPKGERCECKCEVCVMIDAYRDESKEE